MYLIYDTETTGLPQNNAAPIHDLNNWPRLVQLAWQLHDEKGKLLSHGNDIVYPEGYSIPFNAQQIHGISTERAKQEGIPIAEALTSFAQALQQAKAVVGHNVSFDNKIVGAEFLRLQRPNAIADKKSIDTAAETKSFCKLSGGLGGQYKFPKLSELYEILFEKKL